MADGEKEGKTEPATPKRRQEAYDNGNFPRSQDLTAAVMLTTGLLVVKWAGPGLINHLANMLRSLLGNMYWADRNELLDNSVRMAMRPMAAILLPIFAYMMGASILVNVMQVGFRFTTKPIMPNLGKLNPMNGFGRLLGGQNYFQLAMNSVKLVLVGTVGYQRCMHHMAMILSLSDMDFPANMMIACGIVYDLGIRIAVGLLILAIFDWIYHKWKFESSIKMSKQEIKEESRSSEGDPEIKGRRRQMARKMIMQRIRSDVPRADVVVTNPTHLAIALKYDPETMRAPRVLAKGADFLAMSIRQVAIEHGVPIVERKPLAQALYKSVEVGQEVPPEFYQAIAEILAYVYELSGKARTMRQRRPVEQSV